MSPGEVARRTEALMEDCLRVDQLGYQAGVEPDPESDALIQLTLREARERRWRWQRRRSDAGNKQALAGIHVSERQGPATRPREHRARRSGSSSASRGDPDPEPQPPPVDGLRGFLAASVCMSEHLRRRGAKRREAFA
jgi:hypothetical protein